MCDLDRFKDVNDKYGHAAGDDVLREVARRLHASVRSYDMVGRFGGEEFLVVLNKCDPCCAKTRAETLRGAIGGRPILAAGNSLTITMSVGLALSNDFEGCNVEEIIRSADMALYAAKAAGRNCVCMAAPNQNDRCETAEAVKRETSISSQ